MSYFSIITHDTQAKLYDGHFDSFKSCLERAVQKNIDLTGADFRHKDLSAANLDNATMPYSRFDHCNLTGANLSESLLSHSRFDHAIMYGTCLAYSDLSYAAFIYSHFGGTDITSCDMSGCLLAGPETFTLNFKRTKSIIDCIYQLESGKKIPINMPPVTIHGLYDTPMSLLGKHLIFRNESFDISAFSARTIRHYPPETTHTP